MCISVCVFVCICLCLYVGELHKRAARRQKFETVPAIKEIHCRGGNLDKETVGDMTPRAADWSMALFPMPSGHAEGRGSHVYRCQVSKVQEFLPPSQTFPEAAASTAHACHIRRLDVPGVGVTDTRLHCQEPMATCLSDFFTIESSRLPESWQVHPFSVSPPASSKFDQTDTSSDRALKHSSRSRNSGGVSIRTYLARVRTNTKIGRGYADPACR